MCLISVQYRATAIPSCPDGYDAIVALYREAMIAHDMLWDWPNAVGFTDSESIREQIREGSLGTVHNWEQDVDPDSAPIRSVFGELWNELRDTIGSAPTAALLRRAIIISLDSCPSLGEITIKKEGATMFTISHKISTRPHRHAARPASSTTCWDYLRD